MTPNQVIKHFGGKVAAAHAIGFTPQSIDHWLRNKRIPYKTQRWIEMMSAGKLKSAAK